MNQIYLSGGCTEDPAEQERLFHEQLKNADAVLIGAGAGLSTAAGFDYSGPVFARWFADFIARFGIRDQYSGGFYPFPDQETFWAWWSRAIYLNRYLDPPKPVYPALYRLVRDSNYFVLTTNVDHQFQKAGFAKDRLFYTQGDYGLFQSVTPKIQKTYDNEESVLRMLEAQGFARNDEGIFEPPEDLDRLSMRIPTSLIPICPDDGSAMTTNLRIDGNFVQDEGWYAAQRRYHEFLDRHEDDHILYLELGVGMNTPGIIKIPFWQRVDQNPNSFFVTINQGDAAGPSQIADRAVCINRDIGKVLGV